MKRESFVYYRDFYTVLKALPNEDYIKVDEAIKIYAFDGIEPTDLNPMQMIAFNYCKSTIDKNNKKYLSGIKGREFGKLGGRPKKDFDNEETPKKPQNNPIKTPNEGYIDNLEKPQRNPKETPKKPQNEVIFEEEILNDDQIYIIDDKDNKDNIDIIRVVGEEEEKKEKKEKKTNEQTEEELEKRKQVFYNSLVPFVERYGREMLREFFDYWTEPNKSNTKMRFELERTWETSRRLSKWANNQKINNYGTNRYERAKQAEQQLIQDVAVSSIRKLEQERNGEGEPMFVDL